MLILFLVTTNCTGQVNNINTDRPDQSDGVYTITKNKLQLENGITVAKETFINNFMLRYGVTPSTEIRILIDAGKEGGISGLKPITFSIKQRVLKQRKIIPAITFVGYVSFEKLASKNFQSNRIPFEVKLAFENELSDKFSLGYNLGTSNNFTDINITMGLSYAPTDKILTFVEYFSTVTTQTTEHNIDFGIMFLVKPQLQLDIACGRSIFNTEERLFATLGVSYLFD